MNIEVKCKDSSGISFDIQFNIPCSLFNILYLPPMKKLAILLFLPLFAFSQNEHYLLIGTYTSGKSEGIYVYKFNSNTGDFSFVSKQAAGNPSYLAVSPDKKYVYAIELGPG